MNLWQNYVRPTTVSEAVHALRTSPGPAVPLAGGTDLLLDLEQGRHPPIQTLVDLSCIPEMQLVERRGHVVFIGAALPLNQVARHPLTLRHAQALVEACDLVGGPQVRNVATLGGNVAHALPAADGTIALLALGAEAEIAGPAGVRRVALGELFLGPGRSALRHGEEVLVGFYLPVDDKARSASCFKRIMRPQGVALPIINLAIWLEREGTCITDVRVAVAPGSATPFRAQAAENALRGWAGDDQGMTSAADALLGEVMFRSSARRASSEYRRFLVGSLFRDTLSAAWQRAAQRGGDVPR